LLVVIAIIAILAGLLLPALARAKEKGRQIKCLSNFKQLQLCLQMYTGDNYDSLPPNETLGDTPVRATITATTRSWIVGSAWADATDANIRKGVLFRYNGSPGIYKCPSDTSTVRDEKKMPRLRSVAMNMFMNFDPADSAYWHRLGQLPRPSQAFVFIDEHENSIDNANFYMPPKADGKWWDFTATRHNNGTVLSFADGHAESWRWIEPRTMEISRIGTYISFWNGIKGAPNDRDLRRLNEAAQRPSDP
jgi:prepilin-type processing-associated H-X9-DG protein